MVLWNRVWSLPLSLALCVGSLCAQGSVAGVAGVAGVVLDPESPSPLGLGETTGFGHSLAWTGGRLVIGAPRSYRFGERGGALWSWSEKSEAPKQVTVPGMRDWSSLGWSLAVQDGDPALAAGAPGESVAGVASGAVHLLQSDRGGIHWLQRVEPETPEGNSGFGHGVGWYAGELWISAPFAGGDRGFQEGYLARYSAGLSGYAVSSVVHSPAPRAGARFGEAFLATDHGLIVGAPGQQGGGAVFVIPLSGAVGPVSQALQPVGQAGVSSGFGSSLAMTDDGRALAVGAPWQGQGVVHLYHRDASNRWRLRRSLGGVVGTRAFGSELRFEGSRLWISAPGANGSVYCLADWRSDLEPLLFAKGSGDVALGRGIQLGGATLAVGAPGHGHATFEQALKASVLLHAAPAVQFFNGAGGVSAQTLLHRGPSPGLLTLGVGGLVPDGRVELRILDSAAVGGWSWLAKGKASAAGTWKWTGPLPNPDSEAWKLSLHCCNAAPFPLTVDGSVSK